MHLMKPVKWVKYTAIGLLALLLAGLLWPENLIVPVKGATKADWNHQTFRYEPWGSSGVHKGIDIFGKTGTEVVASTSGIVVSSGQLPKGGNACFS
jgi:murein DD-endopeptidase MepM/ murein hydrolase activator NlpD